MESLPLQSLEELDAEIKELEDKRTNTNTRVGALVDTIANVKRKKQNVCTHPTTHTVLYVQELEYPVRSELYEREDKVCDVCGWKLSPREKDGNKWREWAFRSDIN